MDMGASLMGLVHNFITTNLLFISAKAKNLKVPEKLTQNK